jgi:hypothetical protein
MNAEITTLQKDVDRWSATHSVNSVRTRALMYRLLDAVKALAAAPPAASPAPQPAERNICAHCGEWNEWDEPAAAPAPVEPPPAKGKE